MWYNIITGQGKPTMKKDEVITMKVKVYCINKGQTGQYFGLKNAEEDTVLYYAPNNWKTKKGAMNWANKNGLQVI